MAAGMTGGHSTGRLIKGNLCLTQLSLSLLTFFVGLVLWFPATSGLPDYEHEVIISNECRYRYQPRSDCVQSECRMTEQVLFGTERRVPGSARAVCRVQVPSTAKLLELSVPIPFLRADDAANCSWTAAVEKYAKFYKVVNGNRQDLSRSDGKFQDYTVGTGAAGDIWCEATSLRPAADPYAGKCSMTLKIAPVEQLSTGYYLAVLNPPPWANYSTRPLTQIFLVELVEPNCDICNSIKSTCKKVVRRDFFHNGTNDDALTSPIQYGPTFVVEAGDRFCLLLQDAPVDDFASWELSHDPTSLASRPIRYYELVNTSRPFTHVSVSLEPGVTIFGDKHNCLIIYNMTESRSGYYMYRPGDEAIARGSPYTILVVKVSVQYAGTVSTGRVVAIYSLVLISIFLAALVPLVVFKKRDEVRGFLARLFRCQRGHQPINGAGERDPLRDRVGDQG